MVKIYSALFGLSGFGIGLVQILYRSELPNELQLSFGQTVAMLLVSVALMYYGRRYLLMWIGYSASEDDE